MTGNTHTSIFTVGSITRCEKCPSNVEKTLTIGNVDHMSTNLWINDSSNIRLFLFVLVYDIIHYFHSVWAALERIHFYKAG